MPKNFVPQNEERFYQFCQNLLTYVENNLSIWGHIPHDEKQSIEECFADYAQISTSHTQPQEKKSARLKCTRQIRTFVNTYLRFVPVTDVDRLSMGIPNRYES